MKAHGVKIESKNLKVKSKNAGGWIKLDARYLMLDV